MRINLTQTKSMKRYLVYTTDDLRLRPFDPTRFFAPPPNENRLNSRPVEKVGLAQGCSGELGGACRESSPYALRRLGSNNRAGSSRRSQLRSVARPTGRRMR